MKIGAVLSQADGALGTEFATRTARLEEQIHVMRRLWTEPLVTFEGRLIASASPLCQPDRFRS